MKLADLRKSLRARRGWFVYLLECSDGSYYCGITNDINRRLSEHNAGTGAKYTRGRLPVKLLVKVGVGSRSEALKLESMVKKKRKSEKVKFLSEQ